MLELERLMESKEIVAKSFDEKNKSVTSLSNLTCEVNVIKVQDSACCSSTEMKQNPENCQKSFASCWNKLQPHAKDICHLLKPAWASFWKIAFKHYILCKCYHMVPSNTHFWFIFNIGFVYQYRFFYPQHKIWNVIFIHNLHFHWKYSCKNVILHDT